MAACNTAMLLEENGYDGREDNPVTLRERTAQELNKFASEEEPNFDDMLTTPTAAIYVQGILSKYDKQLVSSAQTLRNYITNKLIIETESLDPRVRLKALELLGKITDVGLFTERSEVTVHSKSTQELSDTLRQKLQRLMNAKNAEDATIITPPVRLAPIELPPEEGA